MIEKLQIVKNEESFSWNDKKISFQNGFLAPQAEWNVVVKFDGIEFLATATINKNPDPNKDFLPLMVDFREMFYSSWKIWGAPYRRKEWKPSDEAVLVSRLIDRSIRPLFPSWMINDVVLTITTLQIDRKNLYWVPGIIAASLAIMMWWIEFEWPIWAVRIGYKDGKYIINPTKDTLWMMNLLIAGTKDTITMIEAGGQDIPEEILINAIDIAQKEIKFICEKQEEFVKKYNKKHNEATIAKVNEELLEQAQKLANDYENKFFPTNKEEFQSLYNEIIEKLQEKYEDNEEISSTMINQAVFKAVKKVLRTHLLKTWNRLDGRNPLQVRPLYTEVGLFERVYGSCDI